MGYQTYSLTNPLSPNFIYVVASLTIPAYIRNDQVRTHDFSPLWTPDVFFPKSSPLRQRAPSVAHPKPAESSIPPNPISKTGVTTYIELFHFFPFSRLLSGPNHFDFLALQHSLYWLNASV